MAGPLDLDRWAEENATRFPGRDAAEVALILGIWRSAAADAAGLADVELAAPLQRHLTARGTGLPTNFALVLTAAEVIALKFDPRNSTHPLEVVPKQFGKRVESWPRGSVALGDPDPGRMATGLTLRIEGRDPVPCRTPKLDGNPASAAMVEALGGELPPP